MPSIERGSPDSGVQSLPQAPDIGQQIAHLASREAHVRHRRVRIGHEALERLDLGIGLLGDGREETSATAAVWPALTRWQEAHQRSAIAPPDSALPCARALAAEPASDSSTSIAKRRSSVACRTSGALRKIAVARRAPVPNAGISHCVPFGYGGAHKYVRWRTPR